MDFLILFHHLRIRLDVWILSRMTLGYYLTTAYTAGVTISALVYFLFERDCRKLACLFVRLLKSDDGTTLERQKERRGYPSRLLRRRYCFSRRTLDHLAVWILIRKLDVMLLCLGFLGTGSDWL